MAWTLFKPLFRQVQEGKRLKIDYYRFKKDYRIFSGLLSEKPQISTELKGLSEMVYGNSISGLEIVIVTNPFCGYCKSVHTMVEKILEKYEDKLKVVIRFNINTSYPDSEVVSITTNLMNIHLTQGPEESLEAMQEAFHKLSAQDWITKWTDKDFFPGHLLDDVQLQKDWCTENKINFTPAVLINGRFMPKEYEREDLLFFIDDLYEDYSTEKLIDEALAQ